jgi:hypothetical protein
MDDLGGDVFLSTTLNMGCGGGYYGSQMHWNTSAMNLDWAIWDIAGDVKGKSTGNAHPINPTNKDEQPVDRQGKLCSTAEPPAKGFTECPCSRYSGEGFGVHCGIGAADGFLWELHTPYTLNISLLEGNTTGALFGFTITNEKSKQQIELGKIYTANPGPDKDSPQGYDCNRMFVGGGSFQEYYDGGNFTSWATISGPRFRGVEGQKEDIVPTGFQQCCFFGNCSGGYGGCQNQSMFYSSGGADAKCSKAPTAAEATCGYGGLPAVSFKGGFGQPVDPQFVPPWYNWAPKMSKDGSAGPDGGMLPVSSDCDFAFHSNRDGGDQSATTWSTIPYPGSQPYSMPEKCDGEALKAGQCSKQCCAYCLADRDCVEARLGYEGAPGCVLVHSNLKLPFGPWNNSTKDNPITTIIPRRA